MQFTTVRSKEKDYDIYLKTEKLVHSHLGARKKYFPAIWKWKKTGSQLFRVVTTYCCSYLEREKSESLLFGDQKMQFTTVRSKEKDYEHLFKVRKTGSQPVGGRKKCFPVISNQEKTGSYLFRV